MANAISLASKYLPLLDAKYQMESKTSILNISGELIQATVNANQILIPSMVLSGLEDYNRNTGFVAGDNTLTWVAHTFTRDRGTSFMIDEQDNLETMGIAFGSLAGEFIRMHVAPESDAYKVKKMHDKASTVVSENLTYDTVVNSIDTATAALDNAEVNEENRIIFVSTEVYQLMKQSGELQRKFDVQSGNQSVDRRIEMFDGMRIIKMPAGRFMSNYTFTSGYAPAVGAKAINFIMLDKGAVMGLVKTAKPRIFSPEVNQSADSWKFDYRIYEDTFVLANREDGIYVSKKV